MAKTKLRRGRDFGVSNMKGYMEVGDVWVSDTKRHMEVGRCLGK